MDWKKTAKAILFPPTALMIILTPLSIVFLVYSMVALGVNSAPAIISYVIAFYTLSVWFIKTPALIKGFKSFKARNVYVQRWREDANMRINVSLYGALIWNTAYSVFNLCLGLWHRTFWFYSLGAYYAFLAAMRFFLVRHTRRHKPGEEMRSELRKYRACGIVFLVMNLFIAIIVFFMVYWNRSFVHHQITTITMALYTFVSMAAAITNIIRYRKYNSPVYIAAKSISLASACVSMQTLASTMLTVFGNGTMDLAARRILLASSGGAISLFIIAMAIYMIVNAGQRIKLLDAAKE